MTKLLKPIDSVNYTETIVKSTLNTITGDDLSFILSPFSGTSYSNLWMGPLFSVPVNQTMKRDYNTLYLEGGWSGTALEYLVKDVGTNVIIGDISKTSFETAIDGLNFNVKIPLDSSYTGATFTGLSTTTLYGSYMKTELYNQKSTTGPRSCSIMDGLLSENSGKVTIDVNQGLPFQNGINPKDSSDNYQSGIIYLFSDDVRKPNVSVYNEDYENPFGIKGAEDVAGSLYSQADIDNTLSSITDKKFTFLSKF